MERSSDTDYEFMLSEDHDNDDKWWFLSTHMGSRTSLVKADVEAEVTEEPINDTVLLDIVARVGSNLNMNSVFSGCLGEVEFAVVDSICAKYGGTSYFRAELVNLVLQVLSLQSVDLVNATVSGNEECTFHTPHISYVTLFFLAAILCLSTFLLTSACSHRAVNREVQCACLANANGNVGAQRRENDAPSVVGTRVNKTWCPTVDIPRSFVRTSTDACNTEDEGTTSVDDSKGLWQEWYDNISEEAEHNLDCYSPK